MAQGNNKPVIKIKRLSLRFGGLQALHDVNLEVRDGEILAIIGPNGAGKTCLLNCINGFYHPYEGEIFYQEKDLTRLKPHRIAELGIARTFQNIELFSGLTALENLMSARHIHMKRGAFLGCLFFGPSRREEIAHRGEIEEIIDLLEMETIRKKIADRFDYDLGRTVATIRPAYSFDVSCQGSVPESIIAFLDSDDYASAVKNAISLGGDADTMPCIAGGIAQAFYKKIPAGIVSTVLEKLPADLRSVVDRFNQKFNCEY